MHGDLKRLGPLMDFQLLMLCQRAQANKKYANCLPPEIIKIIADYMLPRRRIPALIDFLKSSLPRNTATENITTLNGLQRSYNDALALGTNRNDLSPS